MTASLVLVAILAGAAPARAASSGAEVGSELRAAPSVPDGRAAASPAEPADALPTVARSGELAMAFGVVTVFSDRARVVRTADVSLRPGSQRLRLPSLPATLDPGSVRLDADGARVLRVDVRRADLDELPRGEAEKLLRELEEAQDAEAALASRKGTLEAERQLLASLRPASSPLPSPEGPPVLLETAGWRAAISFFDAREAAAEEGIRALEAQQREAARRTEQLRQRALQLASASTGKPGYVVEALVQGEGPAKLALTYVAGGARWLPAYDVRFSPGSAEVEVDFAGLVSQTTGEDWEGAALVLSTAVPATTATLPKLASWKIGDRDQFIPQPVAKPVPPVAPPPVSARPAAKGDSDALRRALLEAAGAERGDRGVDFGADDLVAANFANQRREVELRRKASEARVPAPPQFAPAPAAPAPAADRGGDYEFESESLSEVAVTSSVSSRNRRSAPTEAVAFGAPASWHAPSFSPELPAALAGGYDFTYPSARRESVRSGGEVRRVALHAVRFPARPTVSVFPALKKQAYVVAEVTNSSERPLLRGQANLFVGADLQGQAVIETTATGEKVTLPLGVDEAIGVERQVNVVSAEKGLLSKDDVTRYEVVIELLNPRDVPVNARVVDQVPLAGNQHVRVSLDRMEPWAIHDEAGGTLEWHLALAPREKKLVKFAYTLTRPRGAQLRQW